MKSSNGYRYRGRVAGYGTIGVAAAAALLMVLSPLAGASVIKTPPFKGTVAVISPSISTGGTCKSLAVAKYFHWLPKTGNVTGYAGGAAKSCTTFFGNGYADGYGSGVVTVGLPLHFKANGAHNISVGTSLAATITAAWAGTATCPSAPLVAGTYTYSDCYRDVSATTLVLMTIYDKTNNSYLYGNSANTEAYYQNYSYASNYSDCNGMNCYYSNYSYSCSNQYYWDGCVASGAPIASTNSTWINTGANCAYSYAGHCYSWQNWTLNASHSLWVVMEFEFYGSAYVSGFPTGLLGVGLANGATAGNTGWKVTSLTIA